MQVGGNEASKKHEASTVLEGIDHGFTFCYNKKDQAFVNYQDACANLYRLIGGPSRELPPVDELEEAKSYKELARTTTRVNSYNLFVLSY